MTANKKTLASRTGHITSYKAWAQMQTQCVQVCYLTCIYLFITDICQVYVTDRVTYSFRVTCILHIYVATAMCLFPAFSILQQSQCTRGQPYRVYEVQRSWFVVQGSQEDALWRDSEYHMPSLAKQSLLHHSWPCAAGKGAGAEALIFWGLPAKCTGDAKL